MEHTADQFPKESGVTFACTLVEFWNARFASDGITTARLQSA
jgi:hypothetical protein